MYDCIVVQNLGEKEDNSDGELDGESDASDVDDSLEIEAELEQLNLEERYN